jgi:hypothetical protein
MCSLGAVVPVALLYPTQSAPVICRSRHRSPLFFCVAADQSSAPIFVFPSVLSFSLVAAGQIQSFFASLAFGALLSGSPLSIFFGLLCHTPVRDAGALFFSGVESCSPVFFLLLLRVALGVCPADSVPSRSPMSTAAMISTGHDSASDHGC